MADTVVPAIRRSFIEYGNLDIAFIVQVALWIRSITHSRCRFAMYEGMNKQKSNALHLGRLLTMVTIDRTATVAMTSTMVVGPSR